VGMIDREDEALPSGRRPEPTDFVPVRIVGEGAYSTVLKTRLVSDPRKVFACKICPKEKIRREKKIHAVFRERDLMNQLSKRANPFFIRLYYTFQDEQNLYFIMTYAKNGELLKYMRNGMELQCAQFYSAEILMALEHMHSLGIVHRDLKPENILLNERMHIQVSDFGSAMIESWSPLRDSVHQSADPLSLSPQSQNSDARRRSFVGTAQYVSPEMLSSKNASKSCDIWALGCIVYQMLTGNFPFRAATDYLIFQKILKLDYSFPDNFDADARHLVEAILVLDPRQRLGVESFKNDTYPTIRDHPFFLSMSGRWENLHTEPSPLTAPADPETEVEEANSPAGFDERTVARLMLNETVRREKEIPDPTDPEYTVRLEKQRRDNFYHKFVEDNLILHQGFVEKRKGLFMIPRKRMFLLTTGPHLYYVDPERMVLRGQVPWSPDIRPEAKNFRVFYVHTVSLILVHVEMYLITKHVSVLQPNRTYYLEDTSGDAPGWCRWIEELKRKYFGQQKDHR
jgi:3-phosphoinositide dependent protein kinase-1